MLHFVTSYMKQNKRRKQTLECTQNGLEIIFKIEGCLKGCLAPSPISGEIGLGARLCQQVKRFTWRKQFSIYLCGHVPKKSPINSERLRSLNEELFWNGAKDWYLFIPKYLIMVLRLKCNFHILYDIYPSSFEANCLKWQCCKHYKACFHFSHCFPFMFLLKLQPMLIIQRFEENELFLDKNV